MFQTTNQPRIVQWQVSLSISLKSLPVGDVRPVPAMDRDHAQRNMHDGGVGTRSRSTEHARRRSRNRIPGSNRPVDPKYKYMLPTRRPMGHIIGKQNPSF